MDKFALSCPVLADESLLLAMKGEFLMSWGEVNWFAKILWVMCLYMKLKSISWSFPRTDLITNTSGQFSFSWREEVMGRGDSGCLCMFHFIYLEQICKRSVFFKGKNGEYLGALNVKAKKCSSCAVKQLQHIESDANTLRYANPPQMTGPSLAIRSYMMWMCPDLQTL